MDEYEISASGARYKAAVIRIFRFLTEELGFEPPTDVSSRYSHALAYEHKDRQITVLFYSAFHPVDYGFEITVYPFGARWGGDDRNMIYYTFKEHQDPEFSFLESAVRAVRSAFA